MSVYTLNDLPNFEKPRERLQQFGPDALSVQELLALILGRGIKNEPVMVIAQRLVSKFGTLEGIAAASIEDLTAIKGLGLAKAAQIIACFQLQKRLNDHHLKRYEKVTSFERIADLLIQKYGHFHKEYYAIVSLDTRQKVLGIDTISIGTLTSSLVHPRETFESAIAHHASSIVICHNHPSGDPTPSSNDLEITEKLINAGKILNITVIDHIIVSKNNYFSFVDQGII